MQDPNTAWIALQSSYLQVQIDPHGAQLSVLRDARGHDLLWNGDSKVWAGRAPILFPTVGTLAGGNYRVDGKSYALPRHGFARGKPFEVAAKTSNKATFRLKAYASTLEVYPFQFQLDVDFALSDAKLSIVSTVYNLGKTEMPASIGYHPGLRWPLPYGQPRAAHFIEFSADEAPYIRRLDAAGLLSSQQHPSPLAGRRLQLTDDLFKDDVVIFDHVRSRSVLYGASAGPRLRVSFPDAQYLGVWTRPGAEFICIEPWRGIADEAGFSGDFKRKLGVFTVAPGQSQALTMELSLLPG